MWKDHNSSYTSIYLPPLVTFLIIFFHVIISSIIIFIIECFFSPSNNRKTISDIRVCQTLHANNNCSSFFYSIIYILYIFFFLVSLEQQTKAASSAREFFNPDMQSRKASWETQESSPPSKWRLSSSSIQSIHPEEILQAKYIWESPSSS